MSSLFSRNYLDLARVGMLLLMALVVHGQYGDPYDNDLRDDDVTRRMLLAMSVFTYMGFVSFLRMTYLPFALFGTYTRESFEVVL